MSNLPPEEPQSAGSTVPIPPPADPAQDPHPTPPNDSASPPGPAPSGKPPAPLDLQAILKAHQEWVESKKLRGSSANFSGIDLYGQDLSGAHLEGADLTGQDLSDTLLNDANLRGANLKGVRFWDADLSGADLKGVKNLLPAALAGADLTGATIPKAALKFEAKAQVENLSTNAGQLFLAMLAGCALAILTTSATTDLQLFSGATSSSLPYIGEQIGTVQFFWIGPFLVLGAYIYFHLYLQRLWEVLALLPAYHTDGTPLDQMTYPWLMNGLVRGHFTHLRSGKPALYKFQHALTILVGWGLAPATLGLFWERYLCRHEWVWSSIHLSLLAVSVGFGAASLVLARTTLRGQTGHRQRHISRGQSVRPGQSPGRRKAFSPLVVFTRYPLLSIGVPLGLIVFACGRQSTRWLQDIDASTFQPGAIHSGFMSIPFQILTLPYRAAVSIRPSDWKGGDESVKSVPTLDLIHRHLEFAEAPGAFMANIDFSRADCRHADFDGSTLSGAVFTGADLEGANLNNASLQDARLQGANLHGADLSYANLLRAKLGRLKGTTNLRGANLSHANLQQADLSYADLTAADLSYANLSGAVFTGANLHGADLTGATYNAQTAWPDDKDFNPLTHGMVYIRSQPVPQIRNPALPQCHQTDKNIHIISVPIQNLTSQ